MMHGWGALAWMQFFQRESRLFRRQPSFRNDVKRKTLKCNKRDVFANTTLQEWKKKQKKSIFFHFSAPTCSCFLYVQICVQEEFIEKPAQDAPHRVFEAFSFPCEGFEFRLMPGVREESPGLEMNLRDLMQIFAMKQIDFPFFPLHKLKRLLRVCFFFLAKSTSCLFVSD